jgi:GntR family transcriptional repressor for pyruvate dehydrogenase complex
VSRAQNPEVGTDARGSEARRVNAPGLPRTVWKTSEVVAFAIVKSIVGSGLRSGDRLPLEGEMLEHYQVSRESLREALRLLEAQGIVTIRRGPQGGPMVGEAQSANLARTMTLYFQLAGATYDELLDAWHTLEPVAAELAARHPDRAAVVSALDTHTHEFHDGGERAAYTAHSNTLHFDVNELAGNRVLGLILGAVGDIIRTHVLLQIDPFKIRGLIDDDHEAIAEAIIDGDGPGARDAMAAHIAHLLPIYRDHWEGDLDSPIEWK